MELKSIKNHVKKILEYDPQARNSDDHLYLKLIEEALTADGEIAPPACVMSIDFFFRNRKKLNIPSYETVRRARQKVQEQFSELRACEAVDSERIVLEEEFRGFARGVS